MSVALTIFTRNVVRASLAQLGGSWRLAPSTRTRRAPPPKPPYELTFPLAGSIHSWLFHASHPVMAQDAATVDRVRELYPPSSETRVTIENDRRVFLTAMADIKQSMVLGVDKNVYVEPTIGTIEWARDFYQYPLTRSS